MNTKILITGAKNINKLDLAKSIIEKNDNLSIARIFTSDDTYLGKVTDDYIYYLNNEDVNLSYKNNSILYIRTIDNKSTGITIDEFYNADIIFTDISDFNNISEHILSKHDILVIWLDTKVKEDFRQLSVDILETKYLIDRLDYTNYMYFLDEDYNDIADVILEYLDASEERKAELREENL